MLTFHCCSNYYIKSISMTKSNLKESNIVTAFGHHIDTSFTRKAPVTMCWNFGVGLSFQGLPSLIMYWSDRTVFNFLGAAALNIVISANITNMFNLALKFPHSWYNYLPGKQPIFPEVVSCYPRRMLCCIILLQ